MFDDFLMQFSADSLFQIRHIRFPFKVQSSDIEDIVETSLVMPEQWKHLDLNYDSAYAKREVDAYEREIQEFKDSSVVSLLGIDNGISWIIFLKEKVMIGC